MNSKKLIKLLAILAVAIFSVNLLANKFYWYYSIWYFDMIMHFWGGFWVGLLSIYIFPPEGSITKSSFLKVLLFTLIIGLGYEVFEVIFYNIIGQMVFSPLDTISDVFFDLSGGVLAILYFLKRIMFTHENEVQLQ